ncbi:LexA family transcriptional regulator [Paenibacillus sp. P46E]|uniref:LexA family protein n=1 Tax=Paenibacillus sp. P46E TaxID=1349436 RepID=UPI00093D25BE|nr:S24 family peptidase [Paenibacillus sp. P46E]OKP97759.1 hypothetical protein A3849_13715 [Paenibacillus sp. P46E]
MNKFYYRVTDDSMSGDRIYTGDHVLVRQSDYFQATDICAIVDEKDISKLQFRRIEEQEDNYLLIPSNLQYDHELRDSVIVIGTIIMNCIPT